MQIKIELSLIQQITIRNVIDIFFVSIECGWEYLKELCSDYIQLYYIIIATSDFFKDINKDKISIIKGLKKENNDRRHIFYYQKNIVTNPV